MSDVRRVALINPNSRRGTVWSSILEAEFGAAGIPLWMTSSPEDLQVKVDEAIGAGATEIWIGGGDGTIGSVIGSFVSSGVTLGILPLGTGNALANELGIPADPKTILDFLLNTAELRQIDVAKVNEQYFCTIATFGITTEIATELEGTDKTRLGRFLYIPAVLRSLRRRKVGRCTVAVDGNSVYRGRVAQVVVANTRTHAGPFAVTDGASLSDGLLSVYWVKEASRGSIWKYALWLLRPVSAETPDIGTLDTPAIEIISRKRLSFVVDGDLVEGSRFSFVSIPRAVRVLAAPL